jgi:hypothetical protein
VRRPPLRRTAPRRAGREAKRRHPPSYGIVAAKASGGYLKRRISPMLRGRLERQG